MSDDSIPGFTLDPDKEALLEEDLFALDEESRREVQLYKSRKAQALHEAGLRVEQIDSGLGGINHREAGATNGFSADAEPPGGSDEPGSARAEGASERSDAPAPAQADDRLEYYRGIKRSLEENGGDASPQPDSPRSGAPSGANASSTARANSGPAGEGSRESRGDPAADPAPGVVEFDGSDGGYWPYIRELQQRLDQTRDRMIEQQQRIGDLRAEVARLEERVRHLLGD